VAVGVDRFRCREVDAAVGALGHGFDFRHRLLAPRLLLQWRLLARGQAFELGAHGHDDQADEQDPEQDAAHAIPRCRTTSSTKRLPT
jgi:hypothetical protein